MSPTTNRSQPDPLLFRIWHSARQKGRHLLSRPALFATLLLLAILMALPLSCAWRHRPITPNSPDPRYLTYDQICDLFLTWSEQYPDIFHTESIGLTGSGRDSILAARISSPVSGTDNRPTLIFHAAQHSNECNGTNVIIEMMERLLTGYEHDDYYTPMVDNLNSWFIPIVNIDGHRKVFSCIPGWYDWRKTLRDNDGNGVFSGFTDGVDMNRNWDYRWEEYPLKETSHSMYKGTRPFSESEVVALRDFILKEMPLFLMDYHSPGVVTPGNVIFWPWVRKETRTVGVDADFYFPIARELASRTQTEVDTVFYQAMASYDTLPKEQCWVYANTGICVLLMEISAQFWWSGPTVDRIASRVADGSFFLMERALAGPGLTGRVTETGTGRPLSAEIRISEFHRPDVGPRLTNSSGYYWRLLTPGNYTVSAHWNGQCSEPKTISISDEEWSITNFEFPPHPLNQPGSTQ